MRARDGRAGNARPTDTSDKEHQQRHDRDPSDSEHAEDYEHDKPMDSTKRTHPSLLVFDQKNMSEGSVAAEGMQGAQRNARPSVGDWSVDCTSTGRHKGEVRPGRLPRRGVLRWNFRSMSLPTGHDQDSRMDRGTQGAEKSPAAPGSTGLGSSR